MPNCPACAESIPASSETCPHCGISVHQFAGGSFPSAAPKTSGASLALILGAVGLGMLVVCGGLLAALLLPAVQSAREAARRAQCRNNLKMIGLALHNYHDTYGSFPPAYVADKSGKPMHSWRVLILPYLDQQPLYDRYRFDEAWDGPNNSQLAAYMPAVYRCPSGPASPADTFTAYAAVFGPNCVFRGIDPVRLQDIIDGTSNTLIVGEVTGGAALHWMKPGDIHIDAHPTVGDPAGFDSDHVGGVHFLAADGGVNFYVDTTSPESLQAMFTIDGKEPPGE